MNRNLLWKFFLVAFIVLWSVYEFYPPNNKDLVEEFNARAVGRDTNLTAIVTEARKLEKARPYSTFNNLKEAIGTNDITRYFPGIRAAKNEPDPTVAILNRLQQESAGKIKLGLDLQGGTSFLVGVDTGKDTTSKTNKITAAEDKDRVLSQAIEVLRKRVDKFGVAEPVLQPAGENMILIQLPGLSEEVKVRARETLKKAAFLEFRMVHPESNELIAQGLGAPGYEKLSVKQKRRGQDVLASFLVRKKAELGLTGAFVERAYVSRNPVSNQPEIILRFDKKGADIFGDVTSQNVGHQMAIVLDGELYSAPRINEPIRGGNCQISGDFDLKEAFELANVLENPLEAPIEIKEERGVDPSLGKDSIQSGVRAAIIGTIAVAAFMAIYYMFAGVVANIALILNIIILLGVMCSVGTTLTLPGIAGVVLTVGMAVDANVLIFERIREELAKGKSLRGALAAGYDRAFSTIFDSHVTTLISSVILIYMGTGTIKGFGVALTIGVAASLFTALVVTRLIFDFMFSRNLLKSLPMLHIIKVSKVDFMKLAKPAFILSWSIILLGIGYGVFVRGHHMMGVDFAGGDNLILRFSQKVNEIEKLRESLTRAGIKDPLIQYQSNISGGAETLRVTTAMETGEKAETTLKKDFPAAKFERAALDRVGPTIGKEIQRSAILASLMSLFGILVYVAFRYEFSFAVGAVVAVIHDVLMTIGCYCLAGREFNATTVAAVLTIIGFSINDTIVIFDRIREDLKLGVRGSFKDLINQALNQTLSRTIITSGTVLLATLSLYIFGGGAINDFAFTFLVGIITGTYSSIYIASALVLWWHKGERPNTASQVMIDQGETARA
jgi:SecD/SecF fusion protein